jgi:riboflavin synthase
MKREALLERARKAAAEIEDRVGMQQLLIVRLRNHGANAMRAAQLVDGLKDALQRARERLVREEAADRLSLWLQGPPTRSIH